MEAGSSATADSSTAASSLATSPASWSGSRPRGIGRRRRATSRTSSWRCFPTSCARRSGAILVWLGLLRQGGFDPAERERALEIIERSARSLERIIEDLLHARASPLAGSCSTRSSSTSGAWSRSPSMPRRATRASRACPSPGRPGSVPIWVKGDPGRLQQAVSNLLSNAIKFTPAGGDVTVSLDSVDQQARLRVADSGEGMSPAFLPFAFERFRQQDSTSTRAHHGLGLGLYVVRHVIGHHGGFVSAESPGPGRGSTFTVLLPLAARPSHEAAIPRAQRTSSQRRAALRTASRSCSSTTRRTHARPCD